MQSVYSDQATGPAHYGLPHHAYTMTMPTGVPLNQMTVGNLSSVLVTESQKRAVAANDEDYEESQAKKKGRKKSPIWDHVYNDNGKVICRHCGQTVRVKYGEKVERLRRHFVKSCTRSPFQKDSKEYSELVESLNGPAESRRKTYQVSAKANDRLVAEYVNTAAGVLSETHRPLTQEQVMRLVSQGNRCAKDNWECVRLLNSCDLSNEALDYIRGCFFSGTVYIGMFNKTITTSSGISLPAGLYNSNFSGTVVLSDNCHVSNCASIANVYIGRNTALVSCTAVNCDGQTAYGSQRVITVGSEASNPTNSPDSRNFALSLNLNYSDVCDRVLSPRTEGLGLEGMYGTDQSRRKSSVSSRAMTRDSVRFHLTILGDDVEVLNCPRVTNSFVGANSRVSKTTLINTLLLSRCIVSASEVTDAVLNSACSIEGNSVIDGVLMYPNSAVSDGAVVRESVLGPDSTVAVGECKRSVLGPFTGFHHNALLVSTIWPLGRGNISYGAMLGANHSSRTNSLEFFPGEGCFFGLNSSVRFPANLYYSPFSIVAANTHISPQLIEFPFSLLSALEGVDDKARALLRPAWVLNHNMYFLERAATKYTKRRKASDYRTDSPIFRPSNMDMVMSAYGYIKVAKESLGVGEYVDGNTLRGAGNCLVYVKDLEGAYTAYGTLLKRYALHGVLYSLMVGDIDLEDDGSHGNDSDSDDDFYDLSKHNFDVTSVDKFGNMVHSLMSDVKSMEGLNISLQDFIAKKIDKRQASSLERDSILRKLGDFVITDSHDVKVRRHQFKVLHFVYPELRESFMVFLTTLIKERHATDLASKQKLQELLRDLVFIENMVAENVAKGQVSDFERSRNIIAGAPNSYIDDDITESAKRRSLSIQECIEELLKRIN